MEGTMEKEPLSDKLLMRAVIALEDRIPAFQIKSIMKQIESNPKLLDTLELGFGVTVRNVLRLAGLPDSRTPSGNWDDYWKDVVLALMEEN